MSLWTSHPFADPSGKIMSMIFKLKGAGWDYVSIELHPYPWAPPPRLPRRARSPQIDLAAIKPPKHGALIAYLASGV